MTKATHTPGPWLVEPLQSTHGADMAISAPVNGWVVAVIQHDPDIQAVEEPDGDTVIWHPADHANALLISQAPAMLAVLRRVAGVMDMTDPESENYADSAADTVQALLDDCADVVRILALIDGEG